MSNVSQTWAIIAALAVIFSAQTAWILYAFARVNKRIDELKDDVGGQIGRLDARLDAGLAKVDARLDELKTEIVRDHGERIAKLEQHVILHP